MGIFGPMKPAKILKKAIDGLAGYKEASEANDEAKKAEFLTIIDKNFNRMTEILYKKKEGEEASARALQLVTDLSHSDFILLGIKTLHSLPVEQRKQFTIIFNGSITHQTGSEYPVVLYVLRNIEILDILLGFYDYPELAVSAGEMLRLCAHHAELARQLLSPARLDKLFTYFNVSHFDVSADSFATFRELILCSPNGEQYINENAQAIIDRIHSTLNESNYAACRQSLKLIGEIIVQYPSFQQKYLKDEKNLIVIMKFMASQYKLISMEAFHIFKLFVAIEGRPEPITKILRANQEKLTQFIKTLLDGVEEQELQREKDYLLMELAYLKP